MPKIVQAADTSGHSERLAINPFDLQTLPEIVRQEVLRGKLDLQHPVRVDRHRPDEVGAVFTCALLDAALICDLLRMRADQPVRVYIMRETWSRLANNVALTIDVNGGQLNPEVFTPTDEDKIVEAPKFKPLEW